MDGILRDIRSAWRFLTGRKGWTSVAVISLALGIGLNTVVFSIVDAVLLRPLPYADPDGISLLRNGTGVDAGRFSGPELARIRAQAALIELAPYWEPYVESGEAGGIRVGVVGPEVFDVLGVRPLLGTTSYHQERGTAAVVLSYGFWQSRMGGDPDVVGQTLISRGPVEIIGVMPRGFFFPDTDVDVWYPTLSAEGLDGMELRAFWAVGRLAPGATLSQAQAEIDTLAGPAAQADETRASSLVPLHEVLIGGYDFVFWSLQGAVGLMLLLACSNVANLLLARSNSRQKELSLRMALGAGRLALFRQLVAESAAVSLVAGIVAVVLAGWSLPLVLGLGLVDVPRIETARLDWVVVAFGIAISAVTGLVTGLVPAWRASRLDLASAIQEGAYVAAHTTAGRLRDGLVIAQVAIALVLLVVTGLLVRTSVALSNIDWGFETETVGVVHALHDFARDPAMVEDLVSEIRSIPGVEWASAAVNAPFTQRSFFVRELVVREGEPVQTGVRAMTSIAMPGFFRTLGTRLRGREFTGDDDARSAGVVILSESLAARLFPDVDPIGRTIHLATVPMGPDGMSVADLMQAGLITDSAAIINGVPDVDAYVVSAETARTVIGVVGDVRMSGSLTPDPVDPGLWLPYRQAVTAQRPGEPGDLATWVREFAQSSARLDRFLIRSGQNLEPVLQTVRDRLTAADPDVTFEAVTPLGLLVSRSIGGTGANRLMLSLSVVFGTLSLLLAGVGVYGAVTHAVSERTREIGVRMALGAARRTIGAGVLGRSIALGGLGLAFGLGGAWASTRLIAGLLYSVSPLDSITLLASAAVIVAVALVAAVVPAWRAMRVDPVVALRCE